MSDRGGSLEADVRKYPSSTVLQTPMGVEEEEAGVCARHDKTSTVLYMTALCSRKAGEKKNTSWVPRPIWRCTAKKGLSVSTLVYIFNRDCWVVGKYSAGFGWGKARKETASCQPSSWPSIINDFLQLSAITTPIIYCKYFNKPGNKLVCAL